MAKIKPLTLLTLLLIINSCTPVKEEETKKRYIEISNEINAELIKKVAKEKNLKIQGTGGSMMENVEMIGLDFSSEKPFSIEQARKLIVDVTEELLQVYNSNEQIRPFLANYPFNSINVHIMISFQTRSSQNENDNIVFVYTKNGSIFYCDYDTEKERYKEVFQETYGDALKKIWNEDQQQPSSSL